MYVNTPTYISHVRRIVLDIIIIISLQINVIEMDNEEKDKRIDKVFT